jgi:integrase
VPAQLMGNHTHSTLCGLKVHVYQRRHQYLARGRYQGRMFGATLGSNEAEAIARLRLLLVEIEDGSFVAPSEARKRRLSPGKVARLSVRQLVNEFLTEKRKLKGRRTADTYRSRLCPVLDFAEQAAVRQRWPLAMDIDRDFAIALRTFLHQYSTTRNGRPGATPKLLSSGQIVNVLECLRTLLSWARRADVRKLPVSWVNPLTPDLVGGRPAKDPLRQDPLPLDARIRLVGLMDRWQLCHLILSLVLPLRPDEAAGLLVSDVNFDQGWLTIGTRLDGGDFTKGRTSFVLPFPDELRAILHTCIAGRAEGPLLRTRKTFAGQAKARRLSNFEELARLHQERLAKAPPETVAAEQDRKEVFRHLLRELGGVTQDQLAKECKGLLKGLDAGPGVSLYALRGSVTTSMGRAKLPHLELRYLTSHSVNDILNHYVSLDPVQAMGLYFATIRPLLDAIVQRARVLGIADLGKFAEDLTAGE